MKIEILGTGCAKCKKLFETARDAVKQSGADAEVVKVEDMGTIINYGVMLTPALAIDGEIKSAGRIPSSEEIKNWIKK